MMLANGMAHAGPYAVGLGIVDPGVGTGRRAIAVATADGPAAGRARQRPAVAGVEVAGRRDGRVEIDPAGGRVDVRVRRCSTARDVFAPAAAHLAAGAPLDRLGVALDPGDPGDDELEDAESEPGKIHGLVVDVDRFGNIRLNARPADLDKAGFGVGSMVEVATTATSVRARRIVAYGDVEPGEYGMLLDAWDWVAVIRFEASAADGMAVTRGDPVWIALADEPSGRRVSDAGPARGQLPAIAGAPGPAPCP